MSGLLQIKTNTVDAIEKLDTHHYVENLCCLWANGITLLEKQAVSLNSVGTKKILNENDEEVEVSILSSEIINDHLKGIEITAKIAKHIKEFTVMDDKRNLIKDLAKELASHGKY